MSSLKAIEKRVFEDLFGMTSGYVLDFSNNTFAEFFHETANIDIYVPKYDFNGDSKAKRLRAFWETEPDALIGKVLAGLLEVWQYNAERNRQTCDSPQYKQAVRIVARLTGKQPDPVATEQEFLHRQYQNISIKNLSIDPNLVPVLESRLAEAQHCLVSAPLATINPNISFKSESYAVLMIGCPMRNLPTRITPIGYFLFPRPPIARARPTG